MKFRINYYNIPDVRRYFIVFSEYLHIDRIFFFRNIDNYFT